MKHLFKSYIVAAGVLMLASCSDDKWEPGPQTGDTMGVYFGVQSDYNLIIEPDDNHLIELTLERLDSEKEAVVPLETVSCPEGAVIPGSATFAAGSKTTTVIADLTNVPAKTSGLLEIKVDPAYATLYGAGTSNLRMNVTMTGAWIPVGKDVKVYYDNGSEYDIYDEQHPELLMLEGTDRFKLTNFMYSGLDLLFRVGDKAEHESTGYAEIVPYKNFIDYEEVFGSADYAMWLLYDSANDTLPMWTPKGSNKEIEDCVFYGGSDYCYIGMNYGYGEMCGYVDYTDGSWEYVYVSIWFTSLFNPFAEDTN